MKLFQRNKKSPLASPAGFRDLYERNRLPIFRYIYGLTGGTQEDVEDLTAETFLRAWKARRRFEGEVATATGWLIQIAKRLVIDEYRHSVQAARNLHFEHSADPAPEQVAVASEQMKLLFHLLAGLNDEQREILVLRYMLGWRVKEIAYHIHMTENNVSVMIHRALSKLRAECGELDSEGMVFTPEEKSHEIFS